MMMRYKMTSSQLLSYEIEHRLSTFDASFHSHPEITRHSARCIFRCPTCRFEGSKKALIRHRIEEHGV